MPSSNRYKSRTVSRAGLIAALVVSCAVPMAAQSVERFALDSVASIDVFGGENVSNHPQIIFDISGGVRITEHVQAFVRPWFRLPRPNTPTSPVPDWSHELYQAGVRYERAGDRGRPAMRVELGYNVSPIGLGIPDTRPSLNPVIGPHLSYVSPMPAFDLTAPRVSAISQAYPLSAQVTFSSDHWDTRGALLNSAPTRNYSLGRPGLPRQTPAFVAGAGLTPLTGLRLGVSLAQGNYATAAEVTGSAPSDRSVTMVGGEGEYAFGFTKVGGEIVRSRFERSEGSAIAYEYFVQGVQTLAPRWFVAARHESTLAPPLITATVVGSGTRLSVVETTVGFRVTPEVTLRSSYYTRRSYAVTAWDHQVAVSAVWARKWW